MLEQTLTQTLLLLSVTIAILVLFRRIGIPASLGYLLVGILLGSKTAGPVIQSDYIPMVAEFGIVFLLFTIGLSFSLSQIYALRHTILGLGTAQVVLTTLVVGVIAWLLGLNPIAAFICGAVFAQSSTTVISKQLLDQGEHMTRHGRLGTTMSVFQDITAVPFVVIIPVLGVAAASEIAGDLGMALLKATAAFFALLLIGRTVLRPFFHIVSRGFSFELFTLTVLFVSLAAAFATKSLGLSMAFGAFLAGMVLGETEFRHQVESAIRPFRDVLLGLFFISIGMLVDPALLPEIWLEALLAALGLLLVKLLLVTAIVRISGGDFQSALRTGMVLAVGGEFGFALLALGLSGGALDPMTAQIILNAVFFSMVLAPFLIRFNQPIAKTVCRWMPRIEAREDQVSVHDPISPESDHVIICGFGRIGQVVGRFLEDEKIGYVALELDPTIVKESRLAGQPVYFGDSSDLAVLESAGLTDAALVIISHDDVTAALRTLELARSVNPAVPIVVRTRGESHLNALRQAGATEVISETVEAGMMMASHAMMLMRVPSWKVADHLQRHRLDRYTLVRKLFRGRLKPYESFSSSSQEQLHSIALDESSPALGQSLRAVDDSLTDATITTLVRAGHRIQDPAPELELKANDVLVLLGTPEALEKAESRLTGSQPS